VGDLSKTKDNSGISKKKFKKQKQKIRKNTHKLHVTQQNRCY